MMQDDITNICLVLWESSVKVYFWELHFHSIIYIYKTVQSALCLSCHMSSVTTSGRRVTQPPRWSTRCRSLSATTSPWRRSVRSSRRRTVRSANWNTVRRRKSYISTCNHTFVFSNHNWDTGDVRRCNSRPSSQPVLWCEFDVSGPFSSIRWYWYWYQQQCVFVWVF